MGIQVQWDNAQPTTIVWTLIGRWTVTDLERALRANDRLLDSAQQQVDFVIDVSQGGLIPRQFIGFMRKYESRQHPLEGSKIVVGADHYLRVFWQGFCHYLPDSCQVQFAGSVEDARAILAEQRESIAS